MYQRLEEGFDPQDSKEQFRQLIEEVKEKIKKLASEDLSREEAGPSFTMPLPMIRWWPKRPRIDQIEFSKPLDMCYDDIISVYVYSEEQEKKVNLHLIPLRQPPNKTIEVIYSLGLKEGKDPKLSYYLIERYEGEDRSYIPEEIHLNASAFIVEYFNKFLDFGIRSEK